MTSDNSEFQKSLLNELLFVKRFQFRTNDSPKDCADNLYDLKNVPINNRVKASRYQVIMNGHGDEYTFKIFAKGGQNGSFAVIYAEGSISQQYGETLIAGEVKFGKSLFFILLGLGIFLTTFIIPYLNITVLDIDEIFIIVLMALGAIVGIWQQFHDRSLLLQHIQEYLSPRKSKSKNSSHLTQQIENSSKINLAYDESTEQQNYDKQ